MAIPKVGAKAPDFTVQTDEGKQVSLSDYKGQNVVLYFYPKDDTLVEPSKRARFETLFPGSGTWMRWCSGSAVTR